MFPKHCFICIQQVQQAWSQTSKLLKGLTQVKYYSSGNESGEKQESKPIEKTRSNVRVSDEDLLSSCLKQFYNPNKNDTNEAEKDSSEHTEVTSETIDSLPTSVSNDNCD